MLELVSCSSHSPYLMPRASYPPIQWRVRKIEEQANLFADRIDAMFQTSGHIAIKLFGNDLNGAVVIEKSRINDAISSVRVLNISEWEQQIERPMPQDCSNYDVALPGIFH